VKQFTLKLTELFLTQFQKKKKRNISPMQVLELTANTIAPAFATISCIFKDLKETATTIENLMLKQPLTERMIQYKKSLDLDRNFFKK